MAAGLQGPFPLGSGLAIHAPVDSLATGRQLDSLIASVQTGVDDKDIAVRREGDMQGVFYGNTLLLGPLSVFAGIDHPRGLVQRASFRLGLAQPLGAVPWQWGPGGWPEVLHTDTRRKARGSGKVSGG